MNTLRGLIDKMYGVKTDIVEKTVVVTTNKTQILGNNPNRLAYLIGNPSTVTLYFAHSAGLVSSSQGLPVSGGNTLEGDWQSDFDVTGYELWAAAASGSVTVSVYEVVTAGG